MRTKFKISILSMLAIVFTFAFVLVGCGDSKTSGETISLTGKVWQGTSSFFW